MAKQLQLRNHSRTSLRAMQAASVDHGGLMGQCPQCDGAVDLLDFDAWQGWRYRCTECGAVATEDEIEHYEKARSAATARSGALARPERQAGTQAEGAD
jgi:hypothetical protein